MQVTNRFNLSPLNFRTNKNAHKDNFNVNPNNQSKFGINSKTQLVSFSSRKVLTPEILGSTPKVIAEVLVLKREMFDLITLSPKENKGQKIFSEVFEKVGDPQKRFDIFLEIAKMQPEGKESGRRCDFHKLAIEEGIQPFCSKLEPGNFRKLLTLPDCQFSKCISLEELAKSAKSETLQPADIDKGVHMILHHHSENLKPEEIKHFFLYLNNFSRDLIPLEKYESICKWITNKKQTTK